MSEHFMALLAPRLRARSVPVLAGMLLVALFLTPLGGCGERVVVIDAPRDDLSYDARGRFLGEPTRERQAAPPNLIVLVIDTLRHDAVAAPGEAGGLMPFTSSLGSKGVHMRDAAAPSSWTVPSMASLLTGLLPSQHGNDTPAKSPRLLDAVTTYAEVLRESHGFETGAYASGPWISTKSSLLQGFTHGAHPYALEGTPVILEGFQRKRDKTKPFFLLLHTYDAHDPYGKDNHPWPRPPTLPGPQSDLEVEFVTEPWEITKHFLLDLDKRLDLLAFHGTKITQEVMRYTYDGYMADPRPDLAGELRAGYSAGVQWVDEGVKSTYEQLEAWGMLENTIFVVTSDHGETFGEHGNLGHGRQLYDELVRIPLVMTGPAPFDGGRAIQGSVALHDIMPTFLDHIRAEPIQGVEGRSFLPLLKGEVQPERIVFSEELVTRANTGADHDKMVTSVRSSRFKYIVTYDRLAGTVIEEAYDLLKDPGEQSDLCAGRGRIDGVTFDEAFCRAVEQARDRIWGEARQSGRLYQSPYSGGRALVTSKRPKACGAR